MLLDTLHIARKQLDALEGVAITREFEWDHALGRWSLTLDLSIESSDHRDVPPVTSWFLTVEPSYPLGLIKLYPATNGGIKVTFPHQVHNGTIQGAPFRKGE